MISVEKPLQKLGLRVLPPVGGLISQRAVLASLLETLRGREETQALGRQLSARTGLKHWILTNSGRSALSITLMSLKALYPDRNEVVIPSYTSYSVPAAVVRAGLRVRLCDIEIETLGPSPKELERAITPRTLCVVPNHLYGIPCQIQALCEIARAYKVPVVEDAAQAMGVRCAGQPAGTFGEATIFSLSRGKPLPAAGGGVIGTNCEALATQCKHLLSSMGPGKAGLRFAVETALTAIFIRPSFYWLPASLPFLKLGASTYTPAFQITPMSTFQKALAARLLPTLEQLQNIRQEKASCLRCALAEFHNLQLIWPKSGEGGFLRLPILTNDRTVCSRVLDALKRQGLGATAGYPSSLAEIPALKPHLAHTNSECVVAKKVSQQLITLATHPWVSDYDIERIVEVFRACSQ